VRTIALTVSIVKRNIVTMTIWAPDLRQRRGPRYLAIADALADDAGAGRLRPGVRLPTHRDLADRLGLTVGTVTRAYGEAARRNLVSGEVGRGTFVRGPAARFAGPPTAARAGAAFIDLSSNHPPSPAGDGEAATLARTLGRLSRRKNLGQFLEYPPPGGSPEHRAAGAEWVRRSGLDATADRVLVSSGNQHGMTAVFAALLGPGDLVLTEALAYPGIKNLAGLLSLRLQGVALDEQGIRPDALAAACRARPPKALYCVPTLQNPTTSIMSEERRRAIAAVAREHGLLIVEDDVHGRIPERAPRPLSAFAPELAVYLTGTSKVLAPGLRVGFVAAPEGLVDRIAAAIRGTTWMAAPLMAEIAAIWIEDGTAEAMLKRKRKEASVRQRLAGEVIGRFIGRAQRSAYHLWLSLPPPWRGEAFAEAARQRGVGVTPASAFAIGRTAVADAVRVCLGAARDRADLERGLRVLAGLLGASPEPAPLPSGP
jgi:DNA-binding transcriptional MocR family regulator